MQTKMSNVSSVSTREHFVNLLCHYYDNCHCGFCCLHYCAFHAIFQEFLHQYIHQGLEDCPLLPRHQSVNHIYQCYKAHETHEEEAKLIFKPLFP